ncbi:hypothetical protein UYSO10_2807 [Kosakonia radicincitans]|nr:hypothetical protein UYSO10_2807 [Kosakonia radicincitans]
MRYLSEIYIFLHVWLRCGLRQIVAAADNPTTTINNNKLPAEAAARIA